MRIKRLQVHERLEVGGITEEVLVEAVANPRFLRSAPFLIPPAPTGSNNIPTAVSLCNIQLFDFATVSKIMVFNSGYFFGGLKPSTSHYSTEV